MSTPIFDVYERSDDQYAYRANDGDRYEDWYLCTPEWPSVSRNASILDEPMEASYAAFSGPIDFSGNIGPVLPVQLDEPEMWPNDTHDDDGERLPEITPRAMVDALWRTLASDVDAFRFGQTVDPIQVERLGAALAGAIRNAQERT